MRVTLALFTNCPRHICELPSPFLRITSLVLRYNVHMNFIRSACKFMWINLILFHMKFMRNSFELHMNFIWTSNEFHMNKFDFISYEIHKKFIWTSCEVHTKFTMNSYVDHRNFMWSYAYMVLYGFHSFSAYLTHYHTHNQVFLQLSYPTGAGRWRVSDLCYHWFMVNGTHLTFQYG